MQIIVALDGSLQRDLIFPPGDDLTIDLTVYAHDGDTDPVTVTNPQLSTGGGALFPIGSQFKVQCVGRTPYRLAVDIDGITTTVAFGIIESPFPGLFCWSCCFCYSGGIFPAIIPTTQAANVIVSDSGSYYVGRNVEDVLAEIAVRLNAGGL